MDTDFLAIERKLQREKRLLDAEVKINALMGLLFSKGLITESEFAAETERVKSSEKYDFDVHEAEVDIEVFRAMLDLGVEEATRRYELLYGKEWAENDGEQKGENEESCLSRRKRQRCGLRA